MGVLGWTPDAFWNSTPYELNAALDGHIEAKGGKRESDYPTLEWLDELERNVVVMDEKKAIAERGR